MTQFFPSSLHLTDAAIQRLAKPEGRTSIRDTKLTQLVLTLGARSKTWYVLATVRRVTKRVRLGPWPIVDTDKARSLALEALRKLHEGVDPTIKVIPVKALTLQAALDAYLLGRNVRASSAADCRGSIEHHAGHLLTRPVAALTPTDVAALYRQLATRSPSAANKLMRNLGAVCRHAATSSGVGDPGVVSKAKLLTGGLQALPSRDVVITDDLQGRWFAEVSTLPPALRGLFVALALTGCRLNELRASVAGGWDSAGRTLTIAQTKNGRAHVLPVGSYLAGMLDEAKSSGGLMFDVLESTVRAGYLRVGKAIGLTFTPHDLRRTFATTAVRTGCSEVIVKRMLNHAAQGVTQKHYLRLSVEDLREPMAALEVRMLGLWGVAAP